MHVYSPFPSRNISSATRSLSSEHHALRPSLLLSLASLLLAGLLRVTPSIFTYFSHNLSTYIMAPDPVPRSEDVRRRLSSLEVSFANLVPFCSPLLKPTIMRS